MSDLASLGIPSAKGKGRRKWIWIGAGALVLIIVVVAVLSLRRTAPVAYQYASVTRGNLVGTVTATGILSARTQVDVGAEISGRVLRVLADFNDTVTEGQILAELDTQQLSAVASQARANVAQANAAVALARATEAEARTMATRAAALAARGLTPTTEVESTEAALNRARAQTQSAAAQLAVARANQEQAVANLGRATIQSPINGVVLRRSVEPGQTVAAAFQAPVLFTLVEDLEHMRLMLDIDEADVGAVQTGQSASFRVDAHPTREFRATIESVRFAPVTVQNVVTYQAVLSVDNPERLLRPGMTATAEITTQVRENVLLVPNAALRFAPPLEARFGGNPERSQRPRGDVLWILENDRPVSLPVRVLAADARMSEVSGERIAEGLRVMVDVTRPNAR